MSPQISIPALEERFSAKLPPELRIIFEPLFKDTIWLSSKWAEYCKLFGEGKDTVDLLNRHAGYLFLIIQDTLWDDVLLHITRLTAPTKTFGKHNLTVQVLPQIITEPALQDQVKRLTESCVAEAAFATAHRNKRLAHTDRDLATSSEPLTGNSRIQIKQFLESLYALLRAIYAHYLDSDYDFSMSHISNDSHALIASLRRAELGAL